MHNWFIIPGAARCGTFEVVSGTLDADFLRWDQYFLVEGSVFNDGLHRYPAVNMQDEVFCGTVYPMAIPRAVINLTEKIEKWCENNPVSDKVSESFGGYSYTKGGSGTQRADTGGWQTAFRKELSHWKKVG